MTTKDAQAASTAVSFRNYAAGSAMTMHHHEETLLCVVLEGSYRDFSECREHRRQAGDLLFCPAGSPHAHAFDHGGTRKLLISLKPEWIDSLEEAGLKRSVPCSLHSLQANAMGLQLEHELAEGAPTDLFQDGLLLQMVGQFGRKLQDRGAPPAWLRQVHDRLKDPACPRCSMEELSVLCGRNAVHLAREFQRFYRMSIGAFQRNMRLQQAAALLRQKDWALTEIALECGFAHHSHFSNDFRKAFGVTPGAYRRAALKSCPL